MYHSKWRRANRALWLSRLYPRASMRSQNVSLFSKPRSVGLSSQATPVRQTASPPPFLYTQLINFSRSKNFPRFNMKYTARPILWDRTVMAFALPYFFASESTLFFTSGISLIIRTMASANAHLKWALPIFFPLVP